MLTIRSAQIAVAICKEFSFFMADTVVISNHNGIRIVLIYKTLPSVTHDVETEKLKEYNWLIFTVHDCYYNLLNRNADFIELFKECVTIKDDLNIVNCLRLAYIPITNYRKMEPMSSKSPLRIDVNNLPEGEVNILFHSITDLPTFISNVLIHLSSSVKEFLSSVDFIFQIFHDKNEKNILMTYYVEEKSKAIFTEHLQLFLYNSVTEHQLGRIEIPYCPDPVHSCLNNKITRIINKQLVTICNELLIENSRKPLTVDRQVTLFILYYLTSAKSYFDSMHDFLLFNNRMFDQSVTQSISSITKHLLDSRLIAHADNKLLRELSIEYKRTLPVLHANYGEIISNWDKIEYPLLKELSHLSIKNIDTYFYSYMNKLLKVFDLSEYNKTFVFFAVNKMLSYEIRS